MNGKERMKTVQCALDLKNDWIFAEILSKEITSMVLILLKIRNREMPTKAYLLHNVLYANYISIGDYCTFVMDNVLENSSAPVALTISRSLSLSQSLNGDTLMNDCSFGI